MQTQAPTREETPARGVRRRPPGRRPRRRKRRRIFRKKIFDLTLEFNVQDTRILEFLRENNFEDSIQGVSPNAAVTSPEAYDALLVEFQGDRQRAAHVEQMRREQRARREAIIAGVQAEEEAQRASQHPVREEEVVQADPDAEPTELPKVELPEPEKVEEHPEPEDQQAPAIETPAIETPAIETPVLTVSEEPEHIQPEEEEAKPEPEPDPVSAVDEEPPKPGVQVEEIELTEEPKAEETSPEVADEVIIQTSEPSPEEEVVAPEEVALEKEDEKVEEPVSDLVIKEEEMETVEDPPEEAEIEPQQVAEPQPLPAAEDQESNEEPSAVAEKLEEPEKLLPDDLNEVIKAADKVKVDGTTVLGKIDLNQVKTTTPKASKETPKLAKKRKKRKRLKKGDSAKAAVSDGKKKAASGGKRGKKQDQTKSDAKKKADSKAKSTSDRGRRKSRKRRAREKRLKRKELAEQQRIEESQEIRSIRLTEFVSTGELADLMGIPAHEIVMFLFEMGVMATVNQRLDAEKITLVAEEFKFEVEFIDEWESPDIDQNEDLPKDLIPRAPVVTVMGHVDHGKTSLLDFIRSSSVAIGESGGITQHIGAYKVHLDGGGVVTFLDTPGHEAFTAMRARGAKVTDVVVLVVAADDGVMPQTIEAINHAQEAGVSIVVAINKIDLPDANPHRVMQLLAEYGVQVEQYGGQIQCAQVSAKTGQGVDDLLEKILLESELLELKGNPGRLAEAVVIESRLDKGRGNVATVLVQNGTLKVGDPFVAGIYSGKVRAMYNEADKRIKKVGPSDPALVLGLPEQPNVGDAFIGFNNASKAKAVAQRRQQIWREQKMRQGRKIRLQDIGRRKALGGFTELKLVIKADVGGSVEALRDALQRLSTDEVAVNIVHSGVGAINESDVMLASASDAVIIGFRVRPTAGAKKVASQEEIEYQIYSVIYDAIEDVRDALEGLLEPEETEKVIANVDVRDIFKVPKVGMIAGCFVVDGKVKRHDKVRVLRDNIEIFTGRISSLRRFKEDVREVVGGYECGIGIESYNDLQVGDQFEVFKIVETKRTLEVV